MGMVLNAAMWGALAASGLVAGAALGLVTRPSRRLVAIIMAFGSGALIAAVASDLCLKALHSGGPLALVAGVVAGGAIFIGAEAAIDARGGFLRRDDTRNRFLRQKKAEHDRHVLEGLAKADVLRALPPEEVQAVLPYVEELRLESGQEFFRKGDEGDALYLVHEGEVRVIDGEREIARVGPGGTFGEMALLSGEPRNATVVASGPVAAYRIAKADFDHLVAHSTRLEQAVHALLEQRLASRSSWAETTADTWRRVAAANVSRRVSAAEELALVAQHAGSSAPVAIFIGALVDGIPESVVIGATTAGAAPSGAFFAAVFLSNFPEAMSSASGMTRAGFSRWRIMSMWVAMMILAAVAAALGNAFLAGAPPMALAFTESIAAGAVLALLANTMMPEAFEQGGRVTGIMTIAGFLAGFLVGH